MIGQKLGSFLIESKLGSGAMGVVYRGTNEANGRPAAIKVVTSELSQKGTAYKRFEREAEILKQLRHPNIVRFMAYGRYQGTTYFAMEYIPGVTLDVLLDERGALPWKEVVKLGIQTADALHYAHEHGVVHRDLKPSNLMVTENGQIKLTDFGIAKDLDATALTATGRTLGTAAYMAPEQIRGNPPVSHKTDLYALGVVLYQMLTGEVPFSGPTAIVMMHRHLSDPPPAPSTKVSDIPVDLDKLVLRLMSKEAPDRPWDAAAVSLALTELREKRKRGEAVKMVGPDAATLPERAGSTNGQAGADTVVARKKPKANGKKAHPPLIERLAEIDAGWLPTASMIGCLIVLIGLLGYWLWPPSAEYYYDKAHALMASEQRSDWIMAEKQYLNELDRRHPGHPYQKEVRDWRDRTRVSQVETRARFLENPGMAAYSNPKPGVEMIFKDAASGAALAKERHELGEAAQIWTNMAEHLDLNDEEERPWVFLARHRAEDLKKSLLNNRQEAKRKLDAALEETIHGRFERANQLRREVVQSFGSYPELADLIAQARADLPPTPQPAPRPDSTPSPKAGGDETP